MMRRWWLDAAGAIGMVVCWNAPAFAAVPWVGRWATTAAVWFGLWRQHGRDRGAGRDRNVAELVFGHCRIGKMYKLGPAAYIQARCWDSNDVPVSLEPRGDRMRVTWNRAKAADLQRCK